MTLKQHSTTTFSLSVSIARRLPSCSAALFLFRSFTPVHPTELCSFRQLNLS